MSQSDRLQRTLVVIGNQVSRGFLASTVLQALHSAYQARRITCARYFFAESYYSCLDISILSFARLLIRHGSSVTIEYLLNCAEQDPGAFPYADKKRVLDAVAAHRQWLQTLSPLVCIVKSQRDQILAQIDRKHINDPSFIESLEAIPIDSVVLAFPKFLEIVNTYKLYLLHSELYLQLLKQEATKDIEYLLNLMEQDSKRAKYPHLEKP